MDENANGSDRKKIKTTGRSIILFEMQDRDKVINSTEKIVIRSANAEHIKKSLDIIDKITNIGTIYISRDKMTISCASFSRDSIATISFPKNFFDTYEVPLETEITFNDDICKAWKKIGVGKNKTLFELNENEDHKFHVFLESDNKSITVPVKNQPCFFTQKDVLDFEKKERKRYCARVSLLSSDFAKMIEEFNAVSILLYLNIMDENKVHFSALGFDINEFSNVLTTDKKKCLVQVKRIDDNTKKSNFKIKGSYSLEYMGFVLPFMKSTKVTTLFFGNYSSLNINLEVKTDKIGSSSLIESDIDPIIFNFYIAPRFADDECDDLVNETSVEEEEIEMEEEENQG